MFFKALELFGFKSFAEKTRLDFEAGVTAIVGPNGCGKSNVSDAIKWVLGEQSVRSMRGSKMEDVIFHGADDVSPVGFAEVSLTISNQNNLLPLEYEEVTVTRRIFRSGESEYLLNKIPVRLKDILELLMDTGLGMPSYSLMEQGQVDQILNSRPEDRRAIFEEASGITKYKTKREEALRKLERTGENLQRLGDIIVEVKRQIKSMERQVSKARRYKEEFEKLKEYELKVSQHQFRDLEKQRYQVEARVKGLETEEMTLISKLDGASADLAQARNRLSLVEEEISNVREKSFEIEASIKTARNKISLDQERIEELTKRSMDLRQKLQGFSEKVAQAAEQIKQTEDQIESIKQQKQDNLIFIESKEQKTNDLAQGIRQAQEIVSEEKAQEIEVIARKMRKKNDLTKLETNLANLNARLRRLNMENQRTQEELAGSEERSKVCAEELNVLAGQVKELTGELWGLRSNLDIESGQKRELEQRLQNLDHQITAVQSRLAFLEEITQTHEGFSSGVKTILAAKEAGGLNIAGDCVCVADLLKVEPKYQMVLELALGEKAQVLLVDDYQAARAASSYLKNKDAGRSSFLCLDSLNQQLAAQSKPDGVIAAALEFVQVEPKYQRAMEYLLANIFVVSDEQAAREILRGAFAQEIKLVTLNGEVLTKTSLLSGSLPKDADSGLLGRRQRMGEYQGQLQQLKQQRQQIESLGIAKDKEIEGISGMIQGKESGLEGLKAARAAKENELLGIEGEKKRFSEELSVLKLETEETQEETAELEHQKQQVNQEFLKIEEQERQIQQRIHEQQELIASKDQQRQQAFIEIAEGKTRAVALDKQAADVQNRLELILQARLEQEETIQAERQESEDIGNKIEQLKQEIESSGLATAELTQTKSGLEEKLNQGAQRRQELLSAIQGLEARLREDQKSVDEVRQRQSGLKVKLTELSYKRDSLKERMQQGYQIDLEGILSEVQELPPVDDFVSEEITRLKSRLEGLGPVNLVAIEENDQLEQRYNFLISQQDDLLRAQDSLRKAISQINHTARAAFAETFQNIQNNFKEYFRLLFNGGDARLILLDENNILESGIEIVARPPGKRLQNISLLSGGEKAMTAIGLLFAIFKVKPSPFCILDEVDAPLDEANVNRFTNLLSEFIKISQFIMITHNKKTINMADVMYGITMEKSGVSKIVSVKFGEKERPPAPKEVAQV